MCSSRIISFCLKWPDDTVKIIEIESWTTDRYGKKLEIKDKEGRVYLVSSYNCVLMNEKV